MKLVFFKEGKKKLKGAGKKIVVLVAMVALLFVTGFVNLKLAKKTQKTSVTQVVTTSGNYFVTYRNDRTATRNREIDILEAVIASPTSTTEAKESATKKRLELIATMEKELALEGLIKSANFEDAIVTTTTENYNVVVKTGRGELTDVEANKIMDIIVSETKCKPSNVKVMSID